MPAYDRAGWEDVLVEYGWEDDMTQTRTVVFEGPVTEEMLGDEHAIPWSFMAGDRVFVYKGQKPYASERTAAIGRMTSLLVRFGRVDAAEDDDEDVWPDTEDEEALQAAYDRWSCRIDWTGSAWKKLVEWAVAEIDPAHGEDYWIFNSDSFRSYFRGEYTGQSSEELAQFWKDVETLTGKKISAEQQWLHRFTCAC